MSWEIRTGDALKLLRKMPAESVQMAITSPPYWGLRDYGVRGQIGLERDIAHWVEKLVVTFAELRRVLRKDGTFWLNVSDSWNSYNRHSSSGDRPTRAGKWRNALKPLARAGLTIPTMKYKDMIGQSWMLALALQADGWTLRDEIIWMKRNTMPSSARDRTTRCHERIFVFAKSRRYYWDRKAAMEPYQQNPKRSGKVPSGWDTGTGGHHTKVGRYNDHNRNVDSPRPSHVPGAAVHGGLCKATSGNLERKFGENHGRPGSHVGHGIPWAAAGGRNVRSVWIINASQYRGAHFATFPPELPRRCISIATKPDDVVLDPFAGAGTTTLVAERLGRDSIGLELNPEYAEQARRRIAAEAPLLSREVSSA